MNQVTEILIEQLGGNKFAAMTGTKLFYALPKGVSFFFGRGRTRANKCIITLNDSDLYDVTFAKVKGINYKQVAMYSGVYAEDLRRVFTMVTGLDTSL